MTVSKSTHKCFDREPEFEDECGDRDVKGEDGDGNVDGRTDGRRFETSAGRVTVVRGRIEERWRDGSDV